MLTGRDIGFPVVLGSNVIVPRVLLALGLVEVLSVSSSGHSVAIWDKTPFLQFRDQKLANVDERLREDDIALCCHVSNSLRSRVARYSQN
jgi:hypothetical protein